MNWTAIAAVELALGVGLGAFGAHGLRDRLSAYSMALWEKAVFYHFVHGLGLLLVSLLMSTKNISRRAGEWACWLLVAGVLIFSGSLYLLAVTGVRTLGAITPLGGIAFIAAWVVVAVAAISSASGSSGSR